MKNGRHKHKYVSIHDQQPLPLNSQVFALQGSKAKVTNNHFYQTLSREQM